MPILGDHDVRRFEIAMHDAGGMRRRQRVGDLDPIPKRVLDGQPGRNNPLIERSAAHQFHGQVGEGAVGSDVEMVTMLGCWSDEASCASCMNRS